MQHGSLIRSIRKHGPDVWQFRWSETGGNGQRVYPRRRSVSMALYLDAGVLQINPSTPGVHLPCYASLVSQPMLDCRTSGSAAIARLSPCNDDLPVLPWRYVPTVS